ncbi:MAG: hypothetical protein JOZ78_00595 [Chroococcidiopsidaceae cyanobacterium CP_BM_ER_R8_30]|nr:hypothetical protein [Chroococcidiopsidaceae cyanobacterium CP_BM_ER_R8_30]
MPTRNTLNVVEFIEILNTLSSCGQAKQLQPSEEFYALAGRAAISTDNLERQLVTWVYRPWTVSKLQDSLLRVKPKEVECEVAYKLIYRHFNSCSFMSIYWGFCLPQ